jgi:type VI protein secretion system component VasF
MADPASDWKQTVGLLRDALRALDVMSKRMNLPEKHRSGLGSARRTVDRSLSRVKTCRHQDGKARRRFTRDAVYALLSVIDELTREY